MQLVNKASSLVSSSIIAPGNRLYLLLLNERILDPLASLHRRNKRQHRTSRHHQPQLSRVLISVLIYPEISVRPFFSWIFSPTSDRLLHIIQHQIHKLVIALQQPDNCITKSFPTPKFQNTHATYLHVHH